jgi:hypothetical protein
MHGKGFVRIPGGEAFGKGVGRLEGGQVDGINKTLREY